MDSLTFSECSSVVRPRVLVSRCLLQNNCRYDGGDNRCPALMNLCTRGFFDVVTICPEMELGMPSPRPPIELVVIGGQVRLFSRSRSKDFTDAMSELVAARISEIGPIDLAIMKSKSPSCGNATTKRFTMAGELLDREGDGFAVARLKRCSQTLLMDERDFANPNLDFSEVASCCEKRLQKSCSDWLAQISNAWKSILPLLGALFLIVSDWGML